MEDHQCHFSKVTSIISLSKDEWTTAARSRQLDQPCGNQEFDAETRAVKRTGIHQ
jgi:hypothetical protein